MTRIDLPPIDQKRGRQIGGNRPAGRSRILPLTGNVFARLAPFGQRPVGAVAKGFLDPFNHRRFPRILVRHRAGSFHFDRVGVCGLIEHPVDGQRIGGGKRQPFAFEFGHEDGIIFIGSGPIPNR